MAPRFSWRSAGFRLAAFAAILLVSVVALLLVTLLARSPREWVLRNLVDAARERVAGELSIGRIESPHPVVLELHDIRWTNDGVVCLQLDHVGLEIDASALRRRELRVTRAEAEGRWVDVPKIITLLGERDAVAQGPPDPPAKPGSRPVLVPTLVSGIRVAIDSVQATELMGIRQLIAEGGADLANGSADARVGGDVDDVGRFGVTLATHDRDSLSVAVHVEALGEQPLLQLAGAIERAEGRSSTLVFEGSLRVPGVRALARVPLAESAMEQAPDLEGFETEIEGMVELGSSLSGRGSVRARQNGWLERLRAEVAWRDGTFTLDSLEVGLRGAEATLKARFPDLEGTADLTVSDQRWLGDLFPGVELPDGFQGTVRAQLDASGGVRAEIRAQAFAHEVAVAVSARVEGEEIIAAVSPIDVRLAPATPELAAVAGSPNVRFDRRSSALAVDAVRIRGDYGEAEITVRHGAVARSTFELDWKATELPPGLARSITDAKARSDLRDAWRRGVPTRLHVAGEVDTRTPERPLDVSGRFVLPGPEAFTPLVPEGMDVQGLGSFRGRFTATGSAVGTPNRELEAYLDLAETTWLDSARVEVRADSSRVRLRSMGAVLGDFRWNATGELTDGSWIADAKLDLEGPALLTRLDARAADLDLDVTGDVAFRGTVEDPSVDVRIKGRAANPAVRVPTIEAHIDWSGGELEARAALPEGLETARWRLDRANLSMRSGAPGDALVPWHYSLEASGPMGELTHVGRLVREVPSGEVLGEPAGEAVRVTGEPDALAEPAVRVVGDSLRLVVAGRDLETTAPFALRLSPGRILIEDLDMSGRLGTLRLDGVLERGATDLTALASFELPPRASDFGVPEPLWPAELTVDVRASDDQLRTEIVASGLSLAGSNPAELRVLAVGKRDSLTATLRLADASRVLVDGELRLPVNLDDPGALLRPADVFGVVRATQFAIPAAWIDSRGAADRRLVLDGELRLAGSAAHPQLHANLRATAPDWPRVSQYAASMDAALGAPGEGGSDLRAQWSIARDGSELVEGSLSLPLRLSLLPFAAELDRSGNASLHLTTKPLPLDELNELLPPQLGVGGSCELAIDAKGPVDDPELSGHAEFGGAKVTLADGSRLFVTGRLELAGRRSRPEVRGNITVENGLIVVPEAPRELHPTSGEALLWETEADAPGGVTVTTPVLPQGLPMDLDIEIDAPGSVWIRGRGIDVELEGALRFVQRDMPSLGGELRAVRGQLQLLGRTFAVRKGSVTFVGDPDFVPDLDIQVESSVADVLVKVRVSGTASQPTLTLTSEPEMSEGDITSLLLFGRKLDELSDDQLGLVQSRTGDVARSFGISRIEDQVRRRTGLDLLTVKTERLSPTSVLVGKYLRPNVLLKFEQMLDEQTAFLVNLEYLLTRRLKLETILARAQRSGIELNWTKDY